MLSNKDFEDRMKKFTQLVKSKKMTDEQRLALLRFLNASARSGLVFMNELKTAKLRKNLKKI